MNAVLPPGRGWLDLVRPISEQRFDCVVPRDMTGHEIPVPDSVVGSLTDQIRSLHGRPQLALDLLAFGDISRDGLEGDWTPILEDELHILPDPHLAAIACKSGKLVIGARDSF